eukprot:CCRYP_007869-RB/>CCRYP_007869-RB protein AED:0.01 eAED:0.01 QI:179/1/1/1/1/0.66/3/3952/351
MAPLTSSTYHRRRILTTKMASRACLAAAATFAASSIRTSSAFGAGRSVGLARSISSLSPSIPLVTRSHANSFQLHMSSTETAPTTTSISSPPRVKTVDAQLSDDPVSIKGWVKTVRKQKTLAFVEVNDGSNLGGIQCVLTFDDVDEATLAEIDKLTTGCSVHAVGQIVKSQGGKQAFELAATSLRIVGTCPGETFPLAKKRHSLEYLRTIAHLRPRTNTIAAVARVRSTLAGAIHSFFQGQGFQYVQTPLITASDCEGAGEMFRVTTLNIDDVSSLVRAKDEKGSDLPGVDYAEDFFGKAAFLTVSGQLGGDIRMCSGRCIHFRTHIPRGELTDDTPSSGVLDGRTRNGIC